MYRVKADTAGSEDDDIGARRNFCTVGNGTQSGDYTATATTLTVAPGTEDEVTFEYTLNGDTMTWMGLVEGVPATIVFMRR